MERQDLNEWFKERLKEGAFGEKQIAQHLIKKGWDIIEISEGDFKEWDIKASINGEIKTFEVKTNYYEIKKRRHHMTVIETKSNGVPSGLSVTTADYYVLYYPFEDFFYIERTEVIKEMIESGIYNKVIGGRNDLSIMYQIPRTDYIHKKELNFNRDDAKDEWWYDWYLMKYINKDIDRL